MVAFISAFLGLVLGIQPVEISVSGEVVSVELRLDGRSIGHLRGEPWVLTCDFGSELAPHELLAIGYDAEGREISRVAQWLNLPQPRSRAELVLVDSAGEARQVQLMWQSSEGTVPDAWRVSFDGVPLEISDPSSFELPSYDPTTVHLLQAELQFGTSLAHTEMIVGGDKSGEVSTELTAFVVLLERGKLPPLDGMSGWFSKDGQPLDVVSVERGGADIVLVQEATPRLWGKLSKMHREALKPNNRDPLTVRLATALHHDDRLRVILPLGQRTPQATLEQFHISFDFATIEAGPTSTGVVQRTITAPTAQGLIASLPYPPEGALRLDAPRRVADAVAVAAQAASASGRARAVVLLKDSATPDSSTHSPRSVRRYLGQLQVPLLVWSPENIKQDDPWGEVRNISTFKELLRAGGDLRGVLDQQIVIWLRGRHLTQDINLSAEAAQRLTRIADAEFGLFDDAPGGESEIETWIAGTVSPANTVSKTDTVSKEDPVIQADRAPEATAALDSTTDAEASPRPTAASEELAEDLNTAESIGGETPSVADSVDVRLVNLEAVVTDSDGRRVHDLERAAFTLFVDSEPVTISHFSAPDSPVDDPWYGLEATPGEKSRVSLEDDEPRLVIFFDALKLNRLSRQRLARSLREVLEQAPPMRTMFVTYDRAMKIRLPFTSEPLPLQELLSQLEDGDLVRVSERDTRGEVASEIARISNVLMRAAEADEVKMAEARREGLLAQLNVVAQTIASDVRATVSALRQLTAGLGGIEGRKLLLYVGDGLELSPAQELYDEAEESLELSEVDRSRLRNERGAFRTHEAFDTLLRDANANRVTFYAVTPKNRGASQVGAERSTIGRAGFQGRISSTRQELVKDAVCRLSNESGGLCQAGGTQSQLLVEQTLEDLSASYSLAFTPLHPPDGAFHPIEIKLNRTDLQIRHREGYTDKEPESRLHDRLAAALFFDADDNDLGITITVEEIEPRAGKALVPLEVKVSVERLGLLPLEQGQKLGAKARLLVSTRNAAGVATGIQEYPIAFQIPSTRLQAPTPLAYAHKVHLMLEPGDHTVAIGLWDEIGRIGSFLSRSVSIAQP